MYRVESLNRGNEMKQNKKSNKKAGNNTKDVTKQLQQIINKKENSKKTDVEKSRKQKGLYSKSTAELKVMLKGNPNDKDILNELDKRRQRWKDYYHKNKEKYKKWGEKWRKNNPEKVKQYRKNYYQKKKVKSSE